MLTIRAGQWRLEGRPLVMVALLAGRRERLQREALFHPLFAPALSALVRTLGITERLSRSHRDFMALGAVPMP
jgi:hypothetical protein